MLRLNFLFSRYSIIDGTPADYSDKFEINPTSGAVRVKSAITDVSVREYQLTIQVCRDVHLTDYPINMHTTPILLE